MINTRLNDLKTALDFQDPHRRLPLVYKWCKNPQISENEFIELLKYIEKIK